MKFLEPTRKPKVIYTDNSLEFGKSFEELFWNHCTSTPHRSETNVIAERALRRVKEGHLRYCCNQVWTMKGGRIPWHVTAICETLKIHCPIGRHHMRGGSGQRLPFGALVGYHPISAKDLSKLHQLGPKVLPGIFLGYVFIRTPRQKAHC